MSKQFKLDAAQMRPLVTNMGACFATDRITVDGERVGYMYREEPHHETDSGWRFFAGDESSEYVDNPDNIALYDVNTICNYDSGIIPYLSSKPHTAFVRDETGIFVEEPFNPPES